MIKNFLIALSVISTGPLMASHFVTCEYEAEVVKIQRLDRLNGTTVEREDFGGEVIQLDVERIATIKLNKVVAEGAYSCTAAGREVQLLISQDELTEYKEGEKLSLSYKNMGDALGSSISWIVNQPRI